MPSSVGFEMPLSVEIGPRSPAAFSGTATNQWSFDLPSRHVRISPGAPAMPKCCEIACREELMPCFKVRREQSSKSD